MGLSSGRQQARFPFPTPGLFQTALRLPVGVCSFFFSSKRNKVSHISLVWFGQGLKETIWTRLEGNHLDKVGRKPFLFGQVLKETVFIWTRSEGNRS